MIIYKIINIINNKLYVGKTVKTLSHRIYAHIKNSEKSNQYIHRAMCKYGIKNFKWEIIENVVSDLNEREKYWIKTLNSLHPNGYNLTVGGEGGDTWSVLGRGHSKETINKMRLSHTGKKHSMESRLKMSSKRKGIPKSLEYRKKLSQSLRNKWEGSIMPESQRKKISLSLMGHKRTEVARANMSFGQTGRKHSCETRMKISMSQKGKKRGPYNRNHKCIERI